MNSSSVFQYQLEQNEKLYSRNIPSAPLQPYLSVRPVMTKYSYLPIVDPRKEDKVELITDPPFNVNTVFNPGNTQSPWIGFAQNINTESQLRNQVYALQRCSQATYIPDSTSDLYKYKFKNISGKMTNNTHPYLFQSQQFNEFNPDVNKLNKSIFFNNTRSGIKELK